MIDTTGSMSDELSYLQAEVADVIHDVREKVGQSVKIRLSVNFYRDHGDAYVVRKFPFTEDIDAAIADLGAQSADGAVTSRRRWSRRSTRRSLRANGAPRRARGSASWSWTRRRTRRRTGSGRCR